jgi:hypothetical protein
MRSLAAILCALAFVVFPVWGAHLFASEPNAWRPISAETGAIRDIDGLEQLVRDFPDSGTVRLRLLQPYIEAGEYEKAMATLEWLYERGYVFSEVAQQQIPKLLDGIDLGRIAERLRAEAEVIEASEVIATVPVVGGLIESVLREPTDDRLIVTSVSEKGLLGKRSYGDWDGYRPDGVDNLSGIALAPDGSGYMVASGRIDGSDGPRGFSGLLGVDLHRMGDEFRIPAPDGVSVSDIVIGPDKAVYASDPIGGGIYKWVHGYEALEQFIAPGTFRSPQGLTVNEDNSRLYVSDYRYGIAIIDLDTRQVSRLSSKLPVILDGIDGMWRYGNELIVVQNGTSPMRIAAFELSEDGMSVIGHRIFEQAHSEWTEPLSGSIDGDALIYIGNGQWDKFVEGKLGQGKELDETQIRALPLRQN